MHWFAKDRAVKTDELAGRIEAGNPELQRKVSVARCGLGAGQTVKENNFLATS